MKNMSVYPQYSKSCKCEVCERLITYLDYLQIKELDYLVCGSFNCKRIMSQKSRMAPLQFKDLQHSERKRLQRLRDEATIKKKYCEKVAKNERRQNQKILQTFLDNNSQLSEKEVQLIRIPSGLTKLATPANERIKNYSKYLSDVIDEAIEGRDKNTVINDQNIDAKDRLLLVEQRFSEITKLRTMADRLCTMCKGGCCPSGEDHAYISASTIAQLMKTKPELSTAEIHQLYLSKVARKTVVGACINQTEKGCSLPRYMRSDICNGYYCEPVKSYLDHEIQTDVTKRTTVIAVQWSNTNWNRLDPSVDNEIVKVALVNETEILPIS